MGSRLNDSETAELLHSVAGELAPDAVRDALVGVIARTVAARRLEMRHAARMLYTLCSDAPGEVGELSRFDDDFYLAEDGSWGSQDEVATAFEGRLRSFEHLTEGIPLPGGLTANG